jgi:hypothetical protein
MFLSGAILARGAATSADIPRDFNSPLTFAAASDLSTSGNLSSG